MKTKIFASTLTLILLLSACAPATTPAPTNTPVDIDAIRTAVVGTIVAPVTQTAAVKTVVAAAAGTVAAAVTQTAAAFTATPQPTETPIPLTGEPSIVYDFVDSAGMAKWQSGAGKLSYLGEDGSSSGFALSLNGVQMETGLTDPRSALLTVPQNKYDGYIEAFYPALTVQSSDRFKATIGCQDGAKDCYVTFRIDYHNSTGTHTLWNFSEKYDGQTYDVDLDLSALAGQSTEFFLLVLASGPASGDRAAWVAPRITRVTLSEVVAPNIDQLQMIDASNGWATAGSEVLRTTNGGYTWHDVSIPGVALPYMYGISFLNATTAWVWTRIDQSDSGKLYRASAPTYHTTDGGLTWTQSILPFTFPESVHDMFIQFIDGAHGVAMTTSGVGMFKVAVNLYQTSDGGATWTPTCRNHILESDASVRCDSLSLSGSKKGMYFQSTLTGWIGGDSPMEGIYLYKTVNGGTIWENQSLAMPAGYEHGFATTTAPVFFNANDGILRVWVSGSDSKNHEYIYETHDGGETWNCSQDSPWQSYGEPYFSSPNDGFLWDKNGALLITHNAGLSWTPFTPSVGDGTPYFISNSIGWLLQGDDFGNSGLYSTRDGGATWTLIYTNIPPQRPP
jgi:photosystem II stability/assembly factor-like uncharacterized protein